MRFEERYQDTCNRARDIVDEIFGAHFGRDSLDLDFARLTPNVLGELRAALVFDLAKRARLTRRHSVLGDIACLVVATQFLGSDWWDNTYLDGYGRPVIETDSPDTLLTRGEGTYPDPWDRSCLPQLANWAADVAADARWGRAVDTVDLNWPDTIDLVRLPADVVAGDQLVVSFDPGGRCFATVEPRPGPDDPHGRRRGGLGSSFELDSCRHCDAARISWAVSILNTPHRVLFPGEELGCDSDPWSRRLDPADASRLHAQALDLEIDAETLGAVWQTAGDALDALARVGWPWSLTGSTWDWVKQMEALIDGVPAPGVS